MQKLKNEIPDEKPILKLKNGKIESQKFNKSNVFDMFNNDIVGTNSYLYPLSVLLSPGAGRVGMYPSYFYRYNLNRSQFSSPLFKASERSELARRFFLWHCNIFLSLHCYETSGSFVLKKILTKKVYRKVIDFPLKHFINPFWNIDTILIQVFCLLCLFSLQYHTVIEYFVFIHQILHCFLSPWLKFLLH